MSKILEPLTIFPKIYIIVLCYGLKYATELCKTRDQLFENGLRCYKGYSSPYSHSHPHSYSPLPIHIFHRIRITIVSHPPHSYYPSTTPSILLQAEGAQSTPKKKPSPVLTYPNPPQLVWNHQTPENNSSSKSFRYP